MFLQEDENMQENILRDSLVTHIFLSYMEAGKKQVVRVKLRFIDKLIFQHRLQLIL